MHRPLLLAATIVLALGAAFGLLMLAYATGAMYIDDPDPDPPLARSWLWTGVGAGVAGLAAALAGVVREDRIWAVGAGLLGALALLGPVLLALA